MSKSKGAKQTHDQAVRRWVFLADPKDYGWDELVAEGETTWDGIRNAQAQKHLRACAAGDIVLIYHTSPDKALVGTARVTEAAGEAGEASVRITPVTPLSRRVPLAEIRADDVLGETSFVRMPRVAVHPLEDDAWDRVLQLSDTDPGRAGFADAAGAGGP